MGPAKRRAIRDSPGRMGPAKRRVIKGSRGRTGPAKRPAIRGSPGNRGKAAKVSQGPKQTTDRGVARASLPIRMTPDRLGWGKVAHHRQTRGKRLPLARRAQGTAGLYRKGPGRGRTTNLKPA